MAHKLNCWEYHNCGREEGGLMVETLGECPVSVTMSFDGTNGGNAAGRACWMVRGEGDRQARSKVCVGIAPCHTCEFYRRVVHEEKPAVKYQLSSAQV